MRYLKKIFQLVKLGRNIKCGRKIKASVWDSKQTLQRAALFAIKDESIVVVDEANVHWRIHHL